MRARAFLHPITHCRSRLADCSAEGPIYFFVNQWPMDNSQGTIVRAYSYLNAITGAM
jgi:hypothetical protein